MYPPLLGSRGSRKHVHPSLLLGLHKGPCTKVRAQRWGGDKKYSGCLGNDFLQNLHTLISEENYIEVSHKLRETSQENLNAIPDSLYYFFAVNEAFTVAELYKPTNPHLWDSMLGEAERTVDDHPSLASLALAARWYMKEDGEWENCNCKKNEVEEGKDEEYEKFFQAALKKFGVDSPADFKSDEEKKKFFNYVDKNYKGENK